MPNWVTTVITFNGNKSDMIKVFNEMGNQSSKGSDQNILDFNKIIPMPESLNVTSGSESELALAYYEAKKFGRLPKSSWHKDIQQVLSMVEKDIKVSSQKMMKLGKQLHDNIEKYGAKDWYDWCVDNWGTKWNACECSLNGSELFFQTAWSWPSPIMIKLAEICSKYNVGFVGKWADEDMGNNTGHFYCNGEDDCLSYDWYDDGSNEAYAAYEECCGESECIGIDNDGNYYHYECGKSCPNCERCGCV